MRIQGLAGLLVIAVFQLVDPGVARAQLPTDFLKQMWSAQWITSPDGPQRDQSVLHFRKLIELAQQPEHFIVHVSADNQFIFYVNQQRVDAGPSRSDLGHWRYKTYDIAPFLRPGRNVLAAAVWNFGVLTPLAQISDRTGFLLHGEGQAERIADTDPTWEVEEEKGIQILPTPEAVRNQYYVAEPAERIDATAFNWGWNTADSGTGGRWKRAQPIGHATPAGAVLQENNSPSAWEAARPPQVASCFLATDWARHSGRCSVARKQLATCGGRAASHADGVDFCRTSCQVDRYRFSDRFSSEGIYRASAFKGHGFNR